MGEAGETGLKRVLGAGAITVYAVGDILGAGIYALVGKVAGVAGGGAWLSFIVSALLAVFTGLTYAELSSRYPVAAGAAAYCRRAFAPPVISFLVGVAVLASGLTSAATISQAIVGYLGSFVELPVIPVSIGFLLLVTLINFLGIQESARVNFALTLVEFLGLMLVIVVGFAFVFSGSEGVSVERLVPTQGLGAVVSGATVAFFAYIGFEDSVNVAEEVRDAGRVVPRAILTAISVTCVIYVAIAVVALLVVPVEVLSASEAPLLRVLETAGVTLPFGVFPLIALFAIANTGLLNMIMVSRLAYGMAHEGLLPGMLTRLHPVRRTPTAAVLLAFVFAVALSVSGGVQVLAQTTTLLLLSVFTVLHVGLVRIKLRDGRPRVGVFVTPLWTPVTGALLCAGLALNYEAAVYARAAIVFAVGVLLYFALGKSGPAKPASRHPRHRF